MHSEFPNVHREKKLAKNESAFQVLQKLFHLQLSLQNLPFTFGENVYLHV